MEFELSNILVTYPNESSAESRKLKIRTNGEFLHLDFIDPSISNGSITLDKSQVKLLKDSLNLILNNNLIEEWEEE